MFFEFFLRKERKKEKNSWVQEKEKEIGEEGGKNMKP